ncbi:MAG TPA: helix-turn-helix transcriptional regulator [Puia sp.]|nr:helix-turn-helix transcriptional regulator [Puia sp.]
MAEQTIHQGRNIRRFREMLGWKQDALAYALGDQWNQQKVSYLEQREVIDNAILEEVAKILKVSPEAIKNFTEEMGVNFISNTFTDNQFAGYTVNNNPTFNPLEKLIEMVEENKKLYEALLKEKDEKIALLEKFVAFEKKKK